MKKRLDERFDEAVLRWFGHVERVKSYRIGKRAYVVVQWVGRESGGLIPTMSVQEKEVCMSGKQGE